jgi:hypothetical protein
MNAIGLSFVGLSSSSVASRSVALFCGLISLPLFMLLGDLISSTSYSLFPNEEISNSAVDYFAIVYLWMMSWRARF